MGTGAAASWRLLLPARVAASVLITILVLGLGGSVALAAERTAVCGRTNAFVRPSADRAGSITLGTRTFGLGTDVRFFPEGRLGDPVVGAVVCAHGEMSAPDHFVALTALGPFMAPYPQCGIVATLRPATASAPGEIVLTESVPAPGLRQTLTIPAGLNLPAEAQAGRRCFAQSLTAAGDLIVARLMSSSDDTATPTPTPTPTVVATSTPTPTTPPPAVPEERGTRIDAVVLSVLAAIAALVIASILLALRRLA
jgi:hypothetical protein